MPYRANKNKSGPVSGPHTRIELFFTKLRIIWRDFWKHRAEEHAAFAEWFWNREILAPFTIVGAPIALIIVIVGGVAKGCDEREESECWEKCEKMGHRDSFIEDREFITSACICVDEDSNPHPLSVLLSGGGKSNGTG